LTVELTSADTAMERRRDILNYLNSKYPGYLENIDLEKTSMTDLAAATAKLNGELINRIVIQRQQEKIDKANEKVATEAESLARSRIKLAAAVAKLEGDLNIKKAEGLTLEQRAQNAMAISIDNAKKYRRATSGIFAQHNDVRGWYNAVVAGERNLQFEQGKANNAIADRNAVMKELGITEEKAQQIASIGAASTREQTKETQVSTEAKRKDIDELGRSADSMHGLKLAVEDLFDTIAKEGTVSEEMELKTLVGALKDGEKAAKKMKDEIISLIGTYDLEPLTAEQAAFNEGVEDTVELLDGKLSPAFNFVANNMESVNHLIGQFGSMFATAFESAFDSMKSKTEIIDYLNANYGEYLENVNLEKMSISELSKATEKLNDETLRGMLLDAERQKFFPVLMKMLGDMIKKLIAAALAAAALAVAITIAFGGNFAQIGKLFGGADSFGKLFGSMFGGMSGIPGLAEGGIVTGPTLAMVGEGRGPEAVIPLDRLHEFAGGGVQVYGRIQGADILLSSERADRVRSRYRGF
jgi:hypothetical protein